MPTDIKVSFERERARFLNSPHSGRRSEMSKKWRCSFCLSEDRDSFGADEPLKDVVAEIVGVPHAEGGRRAAFALRFLAISCVFHSIAASRDRDCDPSAIRPPPARERSHDRALLIIDKPHLRAALIKAPEIEHPVPTSRVAT